MTEESPTPGAGAGLVRDGYGFSPPRTAEVSDRFPSEDPILYEQIVADRAAKADKRCPLRSKGHMLINIRLSELVAYASYCRSKAIAFNVDRWLYSIAWHVQARAGYAMRTAEGLPDPEKAHYVPLARHEIFKFVERAGLAGITDDQVQRAEISVCRLTGRQRMPSTLQGAILRLTADTLRGCKFWSARAIDETWDERQQRNNKERNKRRRIKRSMSTKKTRRQLKDERRTVMQRLMAELGKSESTIERMHAEGDPSTAALTPYDRKRTAKTKQRNDILNGPRTDSSSTSQSNTRTI